ncbi:hypothetical protein PFISCL1PPCAC_21665, partial [Pristionchus fissidentatus]
FSYLRMHCLPLVLSLFFFVGTDCSDQNAYLAFKLKKHKLIRRVEALHDAVREYHANSSAELEYVSERFVNPKELELRLINFYYDHSEHKDMIATVLSHATNVLCPIFPRYLAFDKFKKANAGFDAASLKGVIQGPDLKNLKDPLTTIL